MEASMPVTEIERELEGAEPLVYRTDLHGVITYADSRFIKASGYCAGELYGKSHHIVRHPGMSSAVFMDMWSTVNNGNPWAGVIKSCRKDGSFYWAHAAAAPVRTGGRITGCMMVYRKPTPSQIGEASRRYQCMSEGKEAVPGSIETPTRFSLHKTRVFSLSLVSILAVLLTATGAAGLYFSGMHTVFLAFAIAGLTLSVLAAFLLTRAGACSLKTTANSAAALAFAGLDGKMAGSCGMASGEDRWQRAGEAGHEENTSGANGRVRRLARKANDIAITRVRKMEGGVALPDEAGKAVEGIVVAVKRVAGIMAEISAVPAGQSMTARQGVVMKGKTAAVAGSAPDKPGKLAKTRKPAAPARERAAIPRPMRALKGEEDEWKDF